MTGAQIRRGCCRGLNPRQDVDCPKKSSMDVIAGFLVIGKKVQWKGNKALGKVVARRSWVNVLGTAYVVRCCGRDMP